MFKKKKNESRRHYFQNLPQVRKILFETRCNLRHVFQLRAETWRYYSSPSEVSNFNLKSLQGQHAAVKNKQKSFYQIWLNFTHKNLIGKQSISCTTNFTETRFKPVLIYNYAIHLHKSDSFQYKTLENIFFHLN